MALRLASGALLVYRQVDHRWRPVYKQSRQVSPAFFIEGGPAVPVSGRPYLRIYFTTRRNVLLYVARTVHSMRWRALARHVHRHPRGGRWIFARAGLLTSLSPASFYTVGCELACGLGVEHCRQRANPTTVEGHREGMVG